MLVLDTSVLISLTEVLDHDRDWHGHQDDTDHANDAGTDSAAGSGGVHVAVALQ